MKEKEEEELICFNCRKIRTTIKEKDLC